MSLRFRCCGGNGWRCGTTIIGLASYGKLVAYVLAATQNRQRDDNFLAGLSSRIVSAHDLAVRRRVCHSLTAVVGSFVGDDGRLLFFSAVQGLSCDGG